MALVPKPVRTTHSSSRPSCLPTASTVLSEGS